MSGFLGGLTQPEPEWNAGTVTEIGSNLTLAAGTLSATGGSGSNEWSAGTVTTVGTNLSLSNGTISASGTVTDQWNAGTVTGIGTGLTIVSGTLQAEPGTASVAQYAVGTSTGDIAFTLPATPSLGNILFCLFSHYANQGNYAILSGWTLLEAVNGSTFDGWALAYRAVSITDGETITVTSAAKGSAGVLFEIDGIQTMSPFQVYSGGANLSNGYSLSAIGAAISNNNLALQFAGDVSAANGVSLGLSDQKTQSGSNRGVCGGYQTLSAKEPLGGIVAGNTADTFVAGYIIVPPA